MPDKASFYIHWPFCVSKCPYCDFNSHVQSNIDIQGYTQAYIREIAYFAQQYGKYHITSIYFGGGTPSLMPTSIIANIIDAIGEYFHVPDNIEISLEANPNSADIDNLKNIKATGVNRISIGIQSFNDNNLHFLGRTHDSKEAYAAIDAISRTFDNYSFDLIYALPKQTIRSWQCELQQALQIARHHISLYQLTIEKGTPFYTQYHQGQFTIPDGDIAYDFYQATAEILAQYDLIAYEISNYAKPGYESQHNLNYWHYGNYIGIGAGAHSRINITNHIKAITTLHKPDKWLRQTLNSESGIMHINTLSINDSIKEILIMGLRLTKGINIEIFKQKLAMDFYDCINQQNLQMLLDEKMLEFNHNQLRVTPKYFLLTNSIINQLI